MLVFAEYLVGFAAAYLIVRYIVLPAIRKSDGSGTGSSGLPGDGTKNDRP